MLGSEDYAIVIPARHASSRYPGKPLVKILGISMIQRVWRQCVEAVAAEKVIIATDDDLIAQHCDGFGARTVMTSKGCKTGTDRIAEVVEKLSLSYAINVQGDEPLVRPADILAVQRAFVDLKRRVVVNAMAALSDMDEWQSASVPKVVCDSSSRLLYMSRAPIPHTKSGKFESGFKQVCIYAFSQDHLKKFSSSETKGALEAIEDIEILRFLELGTTVHMVAVEAGTIAVDFPHDVKRVENALLKDDI